MPSREVFGEKPRLAMIFNFRLFWRMTFRALHRTGGTYGPLDRNRFAFLVCFYPIWGMLAIAAWVGFLLDEIFFPGYRRQPVEKPLFIVSPFRSGSTFAHRTLARDPSFTTMTMGHIYLMPSITQRRIFGLLASLDALAGGRCERVLRRLDARTLKRLKLHPFSLFDPEEDEHLLFYAWSTLLAGFVFPYLDEMPPFQYFDTAVPRAQRQRIMAFYKECVQRHLYATGGRFYLAKNPLFSAKIESLLETFPDARIVYLVRNPLEAVPSTVSLFHYAWRLFSQPPVRYPHAEEILEWTKYWYEHPLEVIDRDRSGRCMIVPYDDLLREPDRVLGRIYSDFRYPESDVVESILRDAATESRVHTSNHVYRLEAMGFTREQILREFAQVFDRFDFEGIVSRRPIVVEEESRVEVQIAS
jgi:omega-hydroxy-beta-dihydromenaquinone-9 sulfotransferase